MRMRFHTRTIIRDGREAFLGSQSLREAELDRRRELGLIVDDHAVVTTLLRVFDRDWTALVPEKESAEEMRLHGNARKTVKALVRQLPLAPMVESALRHVASEIEGSHLIGSEFEHELADALREAVEDAVAGTVRKSTARV